MLVAFTVAHITAGQLIKCREQLAESREETVRLNRRIASLEEYAKTAKNLRLSKNADGFQQGYTISSDTAFQEV